MPEFKGQGVSEGIAFGKIMFYKTVKSDIKKRLVENTADEIERLQKAKQSAMKELQQIYEKALKIMSEKNSAIFKAHIQLLSSPDFSDRIINLIATEKVCADYAVYTVAQELMKTLEKGRMTSPVNDIEDVSGCLLRNLQNESFNTVIAKENVIICAHELVPSQILEFNKSKVSGFCLIGNSHSSHVTVAAKAMKIPAVIGVIGLTEENEGKPASIDGEKGIVRVNPNSSI